MVVVYPLENGGEFFSYLTPTHLCLDNTRHYRPVVLLDNAYMDVVQVKFVRNSNISFEPRTSVIIHRDELVDTPFDPQHSTIS